MLYLGRCELSLQILLDYPVDLKIRITSDRRSKMAVVSCCKAEVTVTVDRILGLLERTQREPLDKALCLCSFDLGKKRLDLLGMDLLVRVLDRKTEVVDKCRKLLDLLGIG